MSAIDEYPDSFSSSSRRFQKPDREPLSDEDQLLLGPLYPQDVLEHLSCTVCKKLYEREGTGKHKPAGDQIHPDQDSETTTLVKPTTLSCGHSVCTSHLLQQGRETGRLSGATSGGEEFRCPVQDCRPRTLTERYPNVSMAVAREYPGATLSTSYNTRLAQIIVLVQDACKDVAQEERAERDGRTGTEQTNQRGEVQEYMVDNRARYTRGTGPDGGGVDTTVHPPPTSFAYDGHHDHHHYRRGRREVMDGDEDHAMTPKEDERDNQGAGEADECNHSPAAIFTKRLVDLLTCEICLNLLSDPITTTCQHTFCTTCLQRSLDHSPHCPLCRCHYPNISQYYTYETNKTITSLLHLLSTKAPLTPTQLTDPDLDTPIFVCQLSFPGMPTILHIFEPRYRLMLRAVLKGEKAQFGMIMYPSQEGVVVSYGTMLEIKSVKIFSDGRSVIETWGTDRFRVVKRGERDGYMVGKIEKIQDLPAAMEREIEKNATLHIPPRTPPIIPVADPMEIYGIAPPRTRTSVSPTPTEAVNPQPSTSVNVAHPPQVQPYSHNQQQWQQAPHVGTRRRSISPAPSVASISTISTISSIRSAPSTSATGTSRWHSPSSSRSQTLRRSGTPSAPTLGQQQQVHHGTNPSTHSVDSQGSSSSGSSRTPTGSQPGRIAAARSFFRGGGGGGGSHRSGGSAGNLQQFHYPIEPTTDELAETCRMFIQRLRKGSSPLVIQRLNTVGPEPEDYGLLSFWIAQLLPIDEGEKAKLLPIRSPRLRLRLVVHWIDQFNAAWWFSGCVIA